MAELKKDQIKGITSEVISLADSVALHTTNFLKEISTYTLDGFLKLKCCTVPYPTAVMDIYSKIHYAAFSEEHDELYVRINELLSRMVVVSQCSHDFVDFFSDHEKQPDATAFFLTKGFLEQSLKALNSKLAQVKSIEF